MKGFKKFTSLDQDYTREINPFAPRVNYEDMLNLNFKFWYSWESRIKNQRLRGGKQS